MRRLKIDLEDLSLAFETASELLRGFLDLQTGDVIMLVLSDDVAARRMLEELEADDSGRYVPIPALGTPESYREMMHFIETVQSKELRELLKVATSGRGAFRRFRDALLRYPDERLRWFDFKDGRLRERIADWLLQLGIEPEAPGLTP